MHDHEIHYWLRDLAPTLMRFMDYNPHPSSGSIDRILGEWLNNREWNDEGRAVASFGFDSLGGEIVRWGRPDDDAVVVYFGSEGGFGVLAPTPVDWVRAIARGPSILEHHDPATLFVPETRPPAAAKALREFRDAAERRFGPGSGPHDLADLNAELGAWVTARRQTFSRQDMMRLGLQGGPEAGALRARVCAALGMRKSNAKALVKRLNASNIDRTAFERAVEAARTDASGAAG